MEELYEKMDILMNSSNSFNNKVISKIIEIIDLIDIVNGKIDKLQYEIDKNEVNITEDTKKRIKEYEKNERMIKFFMPYIFLYNLVENKNI